MPVSPPSAERSLTDQFQAVAAAVPGHIAVDDGTRRLTYRELDKRSDSLASAINTAAGPTDLVGVCLDRTVDLVVAILAVLKSGRAYVPLDPRYPLGRLRYIADDARLPMLIVDATSRQIAQELEVTAVEVDSSANGRVTPPLLDSPAYVIYTSGSTGRPKGVLVSHSNVAALLEAAEKVFQFDCTDVWTLFHSTSSIFRCGSSGARCCTVPG